MVLKGADVRGTRWFGEHKPIYAQHQHQSPCAVPALRTSHASPETTLSQELEAEKSSITAQAPNHDPWQIYEARASIFLGRNVVVARHRRNHSELVHVQWLAMEPAAAHSLVQTITRCSHHSFPRLLGFLQRENRSFLVWEPAEFSLNEVLASQCYILEAELAQMIWPVRANPCILESYTRRHPFTGSYLPDTEGYKTLA
jgi:hypothetical protein